MVIRVKENRQVSAIEARDAAIFTRIKDNSSTLMTV